MEHKPPSSNPVSITRGDPQACFRQWIDRREPGPGLLLVEFQLHQYWLESDECLSLTAIYCQGDSELEVAVTDRALAPDGSPYDEQFTRWVADQKLYVVKTGQPLPLSPNHIPKPWGQEIWYTGVEERGVCCFGVGDRVTPIPWLQAVVPDAAAGVPGEPLVLLKILDPSAEAVTGDLYFELHEEKREVYVVTRVDEEAWPGGVGCIRYGFDPGKLSEAGSESEFRQQYLAAVREYEAVRRSLDALHNNEQTSEQWEAEQHLRARMDSFTHMRPLAVGDVVVVPLLMPHSLQHGVRTVEFQTPVYERQILSFAQRVLTQDHWDTPAAVEQMRLAPPEPEPFVCLEQEDGVLVERIVDFSDFEVRRVKIEGSQGLNLAPLQDYALVMVIEGDLAVGDASFGPEQALLMPRGWGGELAPVKPAQGLVFLLALPRV